MRWLLSILWLAYLLGALSLCVSAGVITFLALVIIASNLAASLPFTQSIHIPGSLSELLGMSKIDYIVQSNLIQFLDFFRLPFVTQAFFLNEHIIFTLAPSSALYAAIYVGIPYLIWRYFEDA